jgi:hypothetical protein
MNRLVPGQTRRKWSNHRAGDLHPLFVYSTLLRITSIWPNYSSKTQWPNIKLHDHIGNNNRNQLVPGQTRKCSDRRAGDLQPLFLDSTAVRKTSKWPKYSSKTQWPNIKLHDHIGHNNMNQLVPGRTRKSSNRRAGDLHPLFVYPTLLRITSLWPNYSSNTQWLNIKLQEHIGHNNMNQLVPGRTRKSSNCRAGGDQHPLFITSTAVRLTSKWPKYSSKTQQPNIKLHEHIGQYNMNQLVPGGTRKSTNRRAGEQHPLFLDSTAVRLTSKWPKYSSNTQWPSIKLHKHIVHINMNQLVPGQTRKWSNRRAGDQHPLFVDSTAVR